MIRIFIIASIFLLSVTHGQVRAQKSVRGVLVGMNRRIDNLYFFPGNFQSLTDFLRNSSVGYPIINRKVYDQLLDSIFELRKVKIFNEDGAHETSVTFLMAKVDTVYYENNESRLIAKEENGTPQTREFTMAFDNKAHTLSVVPNLYLYIGGLVCISRKNQRLLAKRIRQLERFGTKFNWRREL